MEFLTIDFKSASHYEYSPCAVSIYKFSDNEFTEIFSTLINPGLVGFDPKLEKKHGITREKVENAPKLKEVLIQICDIIKDKFIFAHNAGYDISKIIKGCEYYNIEIPNFKYADSLMVSKRTWPNLINYKLDTICEHLNIDLQENNINSGAIACGKIIQNSFQLHNTSNIFELLENIKYVYGYYENNNFVSAYSKKISVSKNKKSISQKIKDIEINTESSSPLNGKIFVFTGSLSLSRIEAMRLIAKHGAIPATSVTQNTNYLVIGNDDYGNFKLGNKSNKMIKAEELINKGQDLELIDEDTFFELLDI